jgi:hypothetical protein
VSSLPLLRCKTRSSGKSGLSGAGTQDKLSCLPSGF